MLKRPENHCPHYHAHVYFDADTLEQARAFCQRAHEYLKVPVGRVHTRPVGPHPHWSCQLDFPSSRFDEVINWLEEHRRGLDILVHGVTGNDLEDHTLHAAWLGNASKLKLDQFTDEA